MKKNVLDVENVALLSMEVATYRIAFIFLGVVAIAIAVFTRTGMDILWALTIGVTFFSVLGGLQSVRESQGAH